MRQEVLRLERITQLAEGVTTLNSFNLHMFAGEILGLVCFDTVGRRELIQLLAQNVPLHYGRVYLREKLVNSYRHSDLSANHVAIIDRNNRLVDDLSVADNIFVLRRGFKKYLIAPGVLARQLETFTAELGVAIRPEQLVSTLTIFEKCVVELLKAVITGTRLVVVQNLSNIVSAADLSRFQGILRHYARQGLAFLYLCEHHEEAFFLCDRVALMEHGEVQRVVERENFSDALIWSYALDFGRMSSSVTGQEGPSALAFSGVRTQNLNGLSFTVQEGECVVLLDVNNNTFGDIVRLLNGEEAPGGGSITLNGRPLESYKRRTRPVAIVQESPAKSMLYYELSYLDNLCFLAGEKTPWLWRRPALRRSIVREYEGLVGRAVHAQDIRALSPADLYSLVYYRVHLANPAVAVCIQPFFGADMYLRHHILHLVDALRKKGIGVLLLSVNLSDTLVLADRLLLVENGRLVGEYHSDEFARFNRAELPN